MLILHVQFVVSLKTLITYLSLVHLLMHFGPGLPIIMVLLLTVGILMNYGT